MKQFTLLILLAFFSITSNAQSWFYDSIIQSVNGVSSFNDFKFYEDGFGWTAESYSSFKVFKVTNDGGKTWVKKTPTAFDYDAINKDSIFSFDISIVKKQIHIKLSTDQGKKWTDYSLLTVSDYNIANLGTSTSGFKIVNSNFIYGITYVYDKANNNPFLMPFIIRNQGKDITNLLTKATNGELNASFDIKFINSSVGLITAKNGTYKTIDGGETWKKISDAKGKICMVNDQLYYIGNSDIKKTTDGGTTWTTIATPASVNQNDHIQKSATVLTFIDENCGAYSSYKKGIFRTTDGGKTWISDSINQGLPYIRNNAVRRIQMMGCGKLFAISGYHFVSNKPLPFGKKQTGSIHNASVNMGSLYPNPASSKVQLDLPLNYKNITIFNALGQTMPFENNNNSFDVSEYANGMYTLQFLIDNKVIYQKFMVQH